MHLRFKNVFLVNLKSYWWATFRNKQPLAKYNASYKKEAQKSAKILLGAILCSYFWLTMLDDDLKHIFLERAADHL